MEVLQRPEKYRGMTVTFSPEFKITWKTVAGFISTFVTVIGISWGGGIIYKNVMDKVEDVPAIKSDVASIRQDLATSKASQEAANSAIQSQLKSIQADQRVMFSALMNGQKAIQKTSY